MTTELLTLTKHHGLGNDFLIAVEPSRSLSPVDAVEWCDRRCGVGADGLIMSERLAADGSVWSMVLWNADGSRAEISGNGIRCLAQAISNYQECDTAGQGVKQQEQFSIRTDGGVRSVVVSPDRRLHTVQAKVDMGPAAPGPADSQKWSSVGLTVEKQGGVDMGNPHLVAVVADPSLVDLAKVGPAVEADYSDGVNIHFVTVNDRGNISLRPWERGAGITQACGSGACAAAHLLHDWGMVDSNVTVSMPGGSVNVEVGGETIYLKGPATFVASVTI